MKWTRHRDASAFFARVRSHLMQHETENCLVYDVTERLARSASASTDAVLYVGEENGEVGAVAVATPPRPMMLTRTGRLEVAALVEQLRIDDVSTTAILAPASTSDAFAGAWSPGATLALRQGVHDIAEVLMPRLPQGAFRLAQVTDHGLLVEWFARFSAELGLHASPTVVDDVAAHIAAGTLVVWDDNGPATMAACVGFSPSGARIGGVYTPPDLRQRGYASACVAVLSRRRLAGGDRRCTLFTDLANASTNAIYASIGYRKVADLHWYRFG